VCGGVALLQVAMGLAARHLERPAVLTTGRLGTGLQVLAVVAVACVVAVAAGAPGYTNDSWQEFKAPSGVVAPGSQDNVFSRLSAADGNSRYQMWQSVQDAGATDSLNGIGPGTFEFRWARHATAPGFVRDRTRCTSRRSPRRASSGSCCSGDCWRSC